jgi:hypothetical protein
MLCAGAEAEEAADTVLEAEVEEFSIAALDEVELRNNDDVVIVPLCDTDRDADMVPFRDMWIDGEPVPEMRSVWTELESALLGVG